LSQFNVGRVRPAVEEEEEEEDIPLARGSALAPSLVVLMSLNL